jgi:BTB/POZ domain
MVKWTPNHKELQRRRRQSAKDRAAHSYRSNWQAVRTELTVVTHPRHYTEHLPLSTEHVKSLRSPKQLRDDITAAMSSRYGSPPQTALGYLDLAKSFKDHIYSDITLFLGLKERELQAHRLVLASVSPYFDQAFRADCIESERKEFRFAQHGAYALWRVFEYMYTGAYSDEAIEELEDEGSLAIRSAVVLRTPGQRTIWSF